MDLKRTAIAIHETGHAIMAVIFKQKIEKLSLKEMIAPNGTDKYLGSMTLVPSAEKSKFTGKEVIQKIMISLGGYASETLFFEDTGKFFGSDLNTAIKWTETLMLEVEFRKWAVTLPPPTTA